MSPKQIVKLQTNSSTIQKLFGTGFQIMEENWKIMNITLNDKIVNNNNTQER